MFSDFIFDNESNSFYQVKCVKFGSNSALETVSGGSETELVMSKTPRSNDFHIVSQEYTKPLSFTFQLVNDDGSDIDIEKECSIKKWLCKRGIYSKLYIDDVRFYDIWFLANISNPQLIKVGNVVGLEFTVTCKSPYGYSHMINKTFNISSNNQQISFYINNHEDNYIYPDLTITAIEDCNLTISNSSEVPNRVFTINNVKANEIITIKGSIPNICTTLLSHKVWSDFNKRWLRFTDGLITLTVSHKCELKISYCEPRKVGI